MHADQSLHTPTSATPRYGNTSTMPAAASTARTAALMANPQTQQWGEMLEFLDYLSFMQDELREWQRDPPVCTAVGGENPTTALLAPPLATSPASTTTTAAAAANSSRSSPPVASSSFSTAPWSSDTAAWPDLGIPSLSASSFSSSSPSHHPSCSGLSLDDHLPTGPAPAVPSSPTL